MSGVIKKKFSNQSFSIKLFISYIVFCIFPFFITGIFIYSYQIKLFSSQIAGNINNSTSKILSLIESKLIKYDTVVSDVLYDSTFLNISSGNSGKMTSFQVAEYLDKKTTSMKLAIPELRDFNIYISTVYQNDFVQPIKDIENNSHLKYVDMHGKTVWFYEKDSICAAYPILHPYTGEKLGVIVLRLDPESFLGNYTDLNVEQYGLYIFGPLGDSLYRYENFNYEIGNVTQKKLDSGQKTISFGTKKYIQNKLKIDSYDILLFCIVPYDVVIDPVNKGMIIPVTIWAICLLLILIICLFLSQSLSKRVQLLASEMKSIAKRKSSNYIPINSKDEIGQISHVYSQTLKELENNIKARYNTELKLKEAEYQSLVSQINPHFLYNTLNMIAGQAIINDNRIIADTAVDLSEYYRTTLNKGKSLILIEDELRNVKAYSALQLKLHDYQFQIVYDIDPLVLKGRTINLCLQPLVENAIEHGIDKRIDGDGKIVLSAQRDGEQVIFQVKNEVSESSKNEINFSKLQFNGYGLRNIQDRIQIWFGPDYGIKLDLKKDWFISELRIPYVENEITYFGEEISQKTDE